MTTLNEDLDAAIALEAMMEEVAETSYAEKPPTSTEQRAEYLAAINDKDLSKLLEMQEQAANMVDQILANPIDLDNLGSLTAKQAESLMTELLDQKSVEALIKLRYSMIRAAVFAHIDLDNRARKVARPETAPGEIPVPTLGKRFTREGGKVCSTFDRDKMAEVLTPEQFARVYPTVHVAAHTIKVEAHNEERFDEDALRDLVGSDFSIMEKLRGAVVPLKITPNSFHTRTLQKKSKG